MKNYITLLFFFLLFSCKKEEKPIFEKPKMGDLVIEPIRNLDLPSHINFETNTQPETEYFLDTKKQISFFYRLDRFNDRKFVLKIRRGNEFVTFEYFYEVFNGVMINDVDNDGIKEITVSEEYFANRDFQTEYNTYNVVKK